MPKTCPITDLTSQVALKSTFPVAHGGFSDIYRAEVHQLKIGDQIVERVPVAVKVLRIVGNCTIERVTKRFNREVEAWRTLQHSTIATLYGICTIDNRPALVLEWYERGTASAYLANKPVEEKLHTVKEISEGLAHVHSQNVTHGDIKASNVLITDQGHAVLSDFGLSRVTESVGATGNTTSSAAGSIRWQAPELFVQVDIVRSSTTTLLKERSKASDVWAFACTVYELLTEHFPYSHLPDAISIGKAVTAGITPLTAEDVVMDSLPRLTSLLRECWSIKAADRPSMTRILNML